jgi:hypothetical protein
MAPEAPSLRRVPLARRLGAALVPAVGVFLLYGRGLGLWWSGDDLIYVRTVVRHTPAQYLFDPAVYRGLSTVFFFPGVLLSFDVDHLFFGVDTRLYFLHQLVALSLAAGLLPLLLARFLPAAAASGAGLLFLLGPRVPEVVGNLGTRHYIEGLAAALGAALLFVRYLETDRKRWLLLSALAWFLAALCKEIYVPLPLVLAALPVRRFTDRWRALGPFVAGGVLYAVWRLRMLEAPFSAYESYSSTPGRVLLLGKQFLATALGTPGTAGGTLAALAGLLAAAALIRRRAFVLPAALVVAVAAPLWPVAAHTSGRFGFLWWLLAAMLAAWASAVWWNAGATGRVIGTLLAAAAFLFAVPPNRAAWETVLVESARNRAEGEFFVSASREGDVLRQPVAERGFYESLGILRREVFRSSGRGRVAYDDLFFCEPAGLNARVLSYSPASGRVEPVPGGAGSVCAKLEARRRELPLTVRLSYDDPVISWQLGPYDAGAYTLVYGDEFATYPASRSGNARYRIRDLTLRVKYDSPDGSIVYSPPLRLTPRDGHAEVSWSREAAAGTER